MQGEGRPQAIDGHGGIGRKIESPEMSVGRGPSAAPTALHGEIAQIFPQWALGPFAGNNLPS
jgi:hypothetical protein